MALSVRTRFEVFKRDEFTCRYCGKKSPDVILEIDHIVPVAEGGSDDPINLATSCWACNSGKSSVPLNLVMTGEDPHDRAIEILERERQLREYNHVLAEVRAQREADVDALAEFWISQVQTIYPHFREPRVSPREVNWLRVELDRTPAERIRWAMELAINKGKTQGWSYVGGILRSWRENGES